MLSPELLEILVCPACKGDLRYEPEAERLVCPTCRLAFAIKDDIPIMLIDEAQRLEESPRSAPTRDADSGAEA
jgi:uncharacterized protein YbaR (Trm112 family)